MSETVNRTPTELTAALRVARRYAKAALRDSVDRVELLKKVITTIDFTIGEEAATNHATKGATK